MDFAIPEIHKSGNRLHVTHGSDSGLYVEFFEDAIQLGLASERAGHPVYENVVMCRIMFPGDKTKTYVGLATDDHKRRFPQQWADFQGGGAQGLTGMPLKEWSPMSRADVLQAQALGLHTVEQLAAMLDTNLPSGYLMWRQKAQAWLQQAKDGSETLRLSKENQDLRDDAKAKDGQIADLAKRLEALEAKRGKAA